MMIYELPVSYDILVSAFERCIHGVAPGIADIELIHEAPGIRKYSLRQDQLGEFGSATLSKLKVDLSEISFKNPPLSTSRSLTPGELAEIKDLIDKEEKHKAITTISVDIRDEANRLAKRRKEHFNRVIEGFFNQLGNENIWPETKQTPSARKIKANKATLYKINKLSEYRNEMKKEKRLIPGFITSCKIIGVDPKTIKKHALELRTKWDDWDF